MNESGKKAYEIAYALWRVAAHAPEKAFADILRNKAIELIGFAADSNYIGLSSTGDSLQAIIKFAVDVNCVSVPNAAILVREIGNMNDSIPSIAAKQFADIEIADIFSDQESINEKESDNQEVGKKAEMRQAAILERIRQIGNCRLSDIQEILPGSSERTLRYDIESLIQRNLIERIGTGGRSIYYRIKPIVTEV